MPNFPIVETPGELNLTVLQGSTYIKSWTCYFTDDDGEPADPWDLSDALVRAQVRPDKNASKLVLEMTTENGLILPVDESGVVTIYLSSDVTTDLRPDVYRWDVEVVDENHATPIVSRFLEGDFTVDGEVTF